jgi:hypothetical protein
MRALITPIHADHSARVHVLKAYIETLKAENESLKRQLAAAEKRVARETAKANGAITEFSAITKRLRARAAERASRGCGGSWPDDAVQRPHNAADHRGR